MIQRTKPPRWTFSPGHVASNWSWLAHHLRFAVPFWDQNMATDVIMRLNPVWSSASTLRTNTVYAVSTSHGMAWKWDETADYQTRATWTLVGNAWTLSPQAHELLLWIPASLPSHDVTIWTATGFKAFLWWTGSNHTLRFWRYTSGTYAQLDLTAGNYPTEAWTHLVINYPVQNGAFKVYFNGALAGTSSTGSGSSSVGSNVVIGSASSDACAGHQFSIARIYDTALSEKTIVQLAADPFGPFRSARHILGYGAAPTQTLLGQYKYRWRLDDGDEDAAAWAASEGIPITVTPGTKRRLRILINATGTTSPTSYQLEFKKKLASDSTYKKVPVK